MKSATVYVGAFFFFFEEIAKSVEMYTCMEVLFNFFVQEIVESATVYKCIEVQSVRWEFRVQGIKCGMLMNREVRCADGWGRYVDG